MYERRLESATRSSSKYVLSQHLECTSFLDCLNFNYRLCKIKSTLLNQIYRLKIIISNIYICISSDVVYDINKSLHTGWTLLLYAASSVQPEIIEYLLTLDADPNKNKGMHNCFIHFLKFYVNFL